MSVMCCTRQRPRISQETEIEGDCAITKLCAAPIPLQNLGNTCFMNATLQCLYFTSPLRTYFTTNDDFEKRATISPQFGNLLKAMSNGKHLDKALLEFKTAIGSVASRFCEQTQEDAHEFLVFLLECLHEEENRVKEKVYVRMTVKNDQTLNNMAEELWRKHRKRDDSVIVDIFHGQTLVQTVCSEDTSHEDLMFEPISQLTLPIPKIIVQNLYSPGYFSQNFQACKVEDCLKLYFEEKLSLDQQWYCEKCDCVVHSRRTVKLWKLPQVLIVHLKKFSYNYSKGKYEKLNDMIKLSAELNLDMFVENSSEKGTRYQLFGVVNHSGELHSGHYYSYVKATNKKWYECNDANICEISLSEVIQTNAYILFYEKVEGPAESHTID